MNLASSPFLTSLDLAGAGHEGAQVAFVHPDPLRPDDDGARQRLCHLGVGRVGRAVRIHRVERPGDEQRAGRTARAAGRLAAAGAGTAGRRTP